MKAHKHGDVTCTRKHGRRQHYRRQRHSRRYHRGGIGSPLNPDSSPSSPSSKKSSSKQKTKKRKVEGSLHKLVLQSETYKKYPRGPPKKSPPLRRGRSPVARNFVKVEEPIMEEEEEETPVRRRSL
jgi:hypothetical protein